MPTSPLRKVFHLGSFGVPLYAIVAPFSISFILGAAAFDGLNAFGIWRQGGAAAHGAFALLIAGIAALVVLIPFALIELGFLENRHAKKIGNIYLALLLNAAVLCTLALCLRQNPSRTVEEKIPQPAFICTLFAAASILIASRLGSHLVYEHRLGVSKPKAIFPALQTKKRHPLHTLFAHLPLGLWAMSIGFDVYANWGQNREPWVVKAAYLCIAIGCAMALCAVLTGFLDWLLTHEEHPAQPWALFHMITSMVGTAIFIFNAGERWKQINFLAPKLNVVALSVFGYLVILIGSIIGMRLVYKNNVTVTPDPAAPQAPDNPDTLKTANA